MGTGPIILPTHTPALFQHAVELAAATLRRGEIVALPTETVYGLAANALDPDAVDRIYAAKGRPSHNPVIVHIVGTDMARKCVTAWPAVAERLATAFWPGPLTLVLPKAPQLPDIVTAGGPTVGIRWPSHPLIQAVIRACGFPLAAPSANLANQLSPTTADHVRIALGHRLQLIVDGGPAHVGIESTVLDLTRDPPTVLRPGMITREALRAVGSRAPTPDEVGEAPSATPGVDGPLRSPGQLPRHYAPRAVLRVLAWTDDAALHRQLHTLGWASSECHVLAHTHIPSPVGLAGVSVLPHDPEAFARALYAELHRCDAPPVRTLAVETPPDDDAWEGIADRLRRAATPDLPATEPGP